MRCLEEDEKKVEAEVGDDKERKEKRKENIKRNYFIGETSQSVNKRALENQLSFLSLSSNSYMLKHIIEIW